MSAKSRTYFAGLLLAFVAVGLLWAVLPAEQRTRLAALSLVILGIIAGVVFAVWALVRGTADQEAATFESGTGRSAEDWWQALLARDFPGQAAAEAWLRSQGLSEAQIEYVFEQAMWAQVDGLTTRRGRNARRNTVVSFAALLAVLLGLIVAMLLSGGR